MWGLERENQIDKINQWATWQWANAKIDKKTFTLFKQTLKITKEDMENYHWAMFTHAMDFFQKWASLKKPIPEERKKKNEFIEGCVDGGFGNPLEPPFNKIYGT